MKSQKKPPSGRPKRSREDLDALREANRVFLREERLEPEAPIVVVYAILLAILAYVLLR